MSRRLLTDPVPLGGVIALVLPSLSPRTVDSFPAVSSVAASGSSVLQQLHHLTLVNGINTLKEKDKEDKEKQRLDTSD